MRAPPGGAQLVLAVPTAGRHQETGRDLSRGRGVSWTSFPLIKAICALWAPRFWPLYAIPDQKHPGLLRKWLCLLVQDVQEEPGL